MTAISKYLICFIVLCLLSLVACQKVIKLNLNDATPVLVIDADMSSVSGLRVQLSRSVGFYDDNDFPAVDSATVLLKNLTTSKIDTVHFKGNGLYTISRKPTVGTTYLLTVIVSGVTYTAQSTMPEIIIPDSVSFRRVNLLGKDIISAKINFQDKAGQDNYYVFRQYVIKNEKWSFFPFSDRLSDGRYIQYDLQNDSAYIAIGDSVRINMQCINKAVYQYFLVLKNITADDNGFGTSSPSNPPTNIVGNALGVFNVHSDYIQRVKVPAYVPDE